MLILHVLFFRIVITTPSNTNKKPIDRTSYLIKEKNILNKTVLRRISLIFILFES